ncbi:MAG: cupin domain-containing protein, partial [Prolixibacteraceae bacterium]|nr:cupin domain-containing protein [Prolixibacteraceae bacterium]
KQLIIIIQNTEIMSESIHAGEKIKSFRLQKNISKEVLAERSGLSLEQITLIEENINVPSLAPLIKIARVLGVRLGTFLDDTDESGIAIARRTDNIKSISFSNNAAEARKHMDYFSLAKAKSDRHLDPFIIDIAASDTDFSLSSHEGEEFIYVLEGKVEINYGKETYLLEQGDSIYYDSIVPHHVHAAEKATAKILAVVYTPL